MDNPNEKQKHPEPAENGNNDAKPSGEGMDNEDQSEDFSSRIRLPSDSSSSSPPDNGDVTESGDFKSRLDLSGKFRESDESEGNGAETGHAGTRSRILLVLNNATLVKNLESLLKDKGFNVFTAMDGDEGMELIRENVPDLIIMDLLIPGKNGLVMVKTLRAISEYERIPVIMLLEKTQASDEPVETILNVGVTEILTKPFLVDWLYNLIEKVIPGKIPQESAESNEPEHAEFSVEETSGQAVTGDTWLTDPIETVDLTEIKENLEAILVNLAHGNDDAGDAETVSDDQTQDTDPDKTAEDAMVNRIVENQKIARLERLFQETQEKLIQKEHDAKEKDHEIRFLKTVHTKLKTELKDKETIVADLQNRLEELSQELPAPGDEQYDDKTVIKKLNQDMKILLNRIQLQVTESYRLQSLLDGKQEEVSYALEYRDRYYDLKEEFDKLADAWTEMNEWKSRHGDLVSELESVTAEKTSHMNRLHDLEQEFNNQKNSLEDALKKVASLENTLQGTEVSKSETESEIARLREEKDELEKQIEEHITTIKRLNEKMTNIEKGKIVLRDKVADDLVEKEVKLMKLKSDIESYQVIFESYYKAKETLQKHAILDNDWPELPKKDGN